MRILQVIPSLATGGAEVFVVSLCNSIVKMGHDVTLLTFYPRQKGEFLYERLDTRVEIVTIGKKFGVDPTLSLRIRKFIKRNGFDVAHFHVNAIAYALIPATTYPGCRYIATIHSDAEKEASGLHRLVRKFLFGKRLMVPVTISKESQRSFADLYHLDSELIFNGVATDFPSSGEPDTINRFRFTDTTKVFTLVASVGEVKNQLNAAKAFNSLAKEGYDVVLVLVGRIGDTDYCRQVKAEASDHVIVYGPYAKPLELLRDSDFFMLVSIYEGMPLSLLEAFSAGVVPVVTNVGGCRNLVKDGENGIICSSCEIEDIKIAVIRALSIKDNEKQQMKARLKSEFGRFSIEKCTEAYLSLYKG